MADVTVKRLEDFEAIFGGGFRRVRAGLGVNSFGIAVMDFPPGFDAVPGARPRPRRPGGGLHGAQRQGHADASGGEDHELEPGVFARVGPGGRRKAHHRRRAALGCSRSAARRARSTMPPEFTEEGAPDPMTGSSTQPARVLEAV